MNKDPILFLFRAEVRGKDKYYSVKGSDSSKALATLRSWLSSKRITVTDPIEYEGRADVIFENQTRGQESDVLELVVKTSTPVPS
ncbi:MAG: hypothetical protein AAB443_01775 [Patescibacteria group bacterium]|mgnify:CR=1 FL=1